MPLSASCFDLLGSRHLQLSIHHRESKPTFDKIERVMPELFVPPALEQFETVAVARCQPFQFFAA
jgi:hypothetical protein